MNGWREEEGREQELIKLLRHRGEGVMGLLLTLLLGQMIRRVSHFYSYSIGLKPALGLLDMPAIPKCRNLAEVMFDYSLVSRSRGGWFLCVINETSLAFISKGDLIQEFKSQVPNSNH